MNDDFLHNHRRQPDAEFGTALYQQLLDADQTLTPVPPVSVRVASSKRRAIGLRLVATLLIILAAGVVALQSRNHTVAPNLAQIDTRLLLDDLSPITPANASQLLEVAQVGNGSANNLFYAPDGKSIAVGTSKGVVVYNADLVPTGTPHFLPIVGRLIGYDGQRIAVIDTTSVRIWDVATAIQQTMLETDTGTVLLTGQLSPDGRWFAAGGSNAIKDSAFYIWDTRTGAVQAKLITHNVSPIQALAFSPNSRQIAVQTASGTRIYDLDLASYSIETTVNNHGIGLAFSPDGKSLAIAHESDVTIWSLDTVQSTHHLNVGTGEYPAYVQSLAFNREGSLLAITSINAALTVWDLTTGNLILQPHEASPNTSTVAFNPVTGDLAVIKYGSTIIVQNPRTAQPKARFDPWDGYTQNVVLSDDNQQVALVGVDNSIRLYNLRSGQLVKRIDTGLANITAVAFRPDRPQIVYSGSQLDGSTIVPTGMVFVDLTNGQRSQNRQNIQYFSILTFTPDGNSIIGASIADNRLWRFDLSGALAEGDLIPKIIPGTIEANQGAPDTIRPIIFTAKGRWGALLWRPKDSQLTLINQQTDARFPLIVSPDNGMVDVSAMAFSGDGNHLVSATNGRAQLWDISLPSQPAVGAQLTYPVTRNPIRMVALNADGSIFAVLDDQSQVSLYDTATNQLLYQLPRTGWMTFSSDSRYLVTLGWDNFIHVYGVLPNDKP